MTKQVPLDAVLAAKAEALFQEIGLDLPTALRLFLLQSLREQGLPFTPRLSAARKQDQTPKPDDTCISCQIPVATPAAFHASDTAAEDAAFPDSGDAPLTDSNDASTSLHAPMHETAEPAARASVRFENSNSSVLPTESGSDGLQESSSSSAEKQPQLSVISNDSHYSCSSSQPSSLIETFREVGLIGASLRRIRTLNRIYAIGDPNPQVAGWRSVLVTGDEPFALDFGTIRVELGFQEGGSLRMMDGRLPDEVLESDAICPRDMSSIFSHVIGRQLATVTSSNDESGTECLHLHFSGGAILNFTAGAEWCRLWLSDTRGNILYAPEGVWMRTLGSAAGRTSF